MKTSSPREGRGWPAYILGGRLRTTTAALLIAFCALWWLYETYEPAAPPAQVPASEVVPPGFIPDPDYTWAPRTDVQQRTPVTTTSTTPTTTTSTTPTTSPTTTPTSPTTPTEPSPPPGPGSPTPSPAPAPGEPTASSPATPEPAPEPSAVRPTTSAPAAGGASAPVPPAQ